MGIVYDPIVTRNAFMDLNDNWGAAQRNHNKQATQKPAIISQTGAEMYYESALAGALSGLQNFNAFLNELNSYCDRMDAYMASYPWISPLIWQKLGIPAGSNLKDSQVYRDLMRRYNQNVRLNPRILSSMRSYAELAFINYQMGKPVMFYRALDPVTGEPEIRNGREVYLVVLVGSESKGTVNDPNNLLPEAIKAGLYDQNSYEKFVNRAIAQFMQGRDPDKVAFDLVGHSQAGIVANNMTTRVPPYPWHFDNVITFGAPPSTARLNPKVNYYNVYDTGDLVAGLTPDGVKNVFKHIADSGLIKNSFYDWSQDIPVVAQFVNVVGWLFQVRPQDLGSRLEDLIPTDSDEFKSQLIDILNNYPAAGENAWPFYEKIFLTEAPKVGILDAAIAGKLYWSYNHMSASDKKLFISQLTQFFIEKAGEGSRDNYPPRVNDQLPGNYAPVEVNVSDSQDGTGVHSSYANSGDPTSLSYGVVTNPLDNLSSPSQMNYAVQLVDEYAPMPVDVDGDGSADKDGAGDRTFTPVSTRYPVLPGITDYDYGNGPPANIWPQGSNPTPTLPQPTPGPVPTPYPTPTPSTPTATPGPAPSPTPSPGPTGPTIPVPTPMSTP